MLLIMIFRRGLRLWVIAWLLFQAASLSAFVPRDCCLAHRPAAPTEEQKCHEPVSDQCVMRASCDGPLGVLLTLMLNLGIPGGPFGLFLDVHASALTSSLREKSVGNSFRPDPPPPRT